MLVNGVVNRAVAFIETLRFMFRRPDLTQILTALSEKESLSLPLHLMECISMVPGYRSICMDFNLCLDSFKIISAPSLPLIHSKQKTGGGGEEENLLN